MRFKDDKRVVTILLEAIQTIINNVKLRQIFESLLLDESLYSHSSSVAKIAVQVGITLGFDNQTLLDLATAGLLHDIGKLKIKRSILYKPTKLSDDEFLLIRKHPVDGYNMLEGSGVSEGIREMILHHHEMIDGSGYTSGICVVNLYTQVITVADITSALTETRCYHVAMSVKDTLKYIKSFNNINQGIVAILDEILSD